MPTSDHAKALLEEVAARYASITSYSDCGAVEILVRGVSVDPDALRRRLRVAGSRSLSVVITRIGTGPAARATAYVCRASR